MISSSISNAIPKASIIARNRRFVAPATPAPPSVIVLPSGTSLRYTVHEVFDGHENPNGTLFTSGHQPTSQMRRRPSFARAQGAPLARLTRVIGAAREAGFLTAATSEPFLPT
jgi:hypothetical protein